MSEAFQPRDNATTSISCSTTTASAAIPGSVPDNADIQLRIHNAGSVIVFIRLGKSGVVATTSDMPIPAGYTEILTFRATNAARYIAAITASSTATLYVTTGDGE